MPRTQKRGDTFEPWTGTVTDSDPINPAVPLGAADECLLVLRSSEGDLIEAVVTVVDPSAVRGDPDCGKWTYTQTTDDVAEVADFAAEMQVTWSPGVIQTFPNDPAQNESSTIAEDLNPPA